MPDRKPYVKDIDGKLYLPTSGGYQRTKTTIIEPISSPTQKTTNDDTAVRLSLSTDYSSLIPMSCYQDSGGAITLNIGNSTKSIILYQKSINDSTLTLLDDLYNIQFPVNTYAWWSAAGGANQYVNLVEFEKIQVDQDGD